MTGLIKSSSSVVSSNLGRRTRRNITRPWFDHESRRMQLKYRRIRNSRRRVSDSENYQALHDDSKDYKNVFINILLHTKKDFIKKPRGLKKPDPKAYWKMLNKFDGSKHDTAQKLSLKVFAEHFKKLNSVPQGDTDPFSIVDPAQVSNFNLELNSSITEQEVLKCTNSLKLNKACASDFILNEFLKFSKSKMLSKITKLFNIVFTSGFIPDSWSQGVISPIF